MANPPSAHDHARDSRRDEARADTASRGGGFGISRLAESMSRDEEKIQDFMNSGAGQITSFLFFAAIVIALILRLVG